LGFRKRFVKRTYIAFPAKAGIQGNIENVPLDSRFRGKGEASS
jgi:hypothetical protein